VLDWSSDTLVAVGRADAAALFLSAMMHGPLADVSGYFYA